MLNTVLVCVCDLHLHHTRLTASPCVVFKCALYANISNPVTVNSLVLICQQCQVSSSVAGNYLKKDTNQWRNYNIEFSKGEKYKVSIMPPVTELKEGCSPVFKLKFKFKFKGALLACNWQGRKTETRLTPAWG